jgi:exocyst complex component 3
MVHRNFQSTEDMVNNLLDMTSQLDHLEHMLASDSREIVGPAPNLLVIHFQLNQLEGFRNQTMHQAKKASAQSQANLARWFARLDKVIANFDEYIVQLARNVLNLVRAGDTDVVVKLLKIADIEGKEDEKVIISCIKNPSAISNCMNFW